MIKDRTPHTLPGKTPQAFDSAYYADNLLEQVPFSDTIVYKNNKSHDYCIERYNVTSTGVPEVVDQLWNEVIYPKKSLWKKIFKPKEPPPRPYQIANRKVRFYPNSQPYEDREYDSDGKVRSRENYSERPDGTSFLKTASKYDKKGRYHGMQLQYHDNGQLKSKSKCWHGLKHGEQYSSHYDAKGKLVEKHGYCYMGVRANFVQKLQKPSVKKTIKTAAFLAATTLGAVATGGVAGGLILASAAALAYSKRKAIGNFTMAQLRSASFIKTALMAGYIGLLAVGHGGNLHRHYNKRNMQLVPEGDGNRYALQMGSWKYAYDQDASDESGEPQYKRDFQGETMYGQVAHSIEEMNAIVDTLGVSLENTLVITRDEDEVVIMSLGMHAAIDPEHSQHREGRSILRAFQDLKTAVFPIGGATYALTDRNKPSNDAVIIGKLSNFENTGEDIFKRLGDEESILFRPEHLSSMGTFNQTLHGLTGAEGTLNGKSYKITTKLPEDSISSGPN